MLNFKKEAAKILSENIEELALDDIYNAIETPPNPDMGDYAFPTFRLAGVYKKSPQIIAQELAEEIAASESFEKIENAGPYLNFYIDKNSLLKETLNAVVEAKDSFGSSDMGEGKTVIVEFSSPNIAKPFHIGHIRTTVIGHALYNIYSFLGYDTVSINHLGDYGTQFGMLIAAIRKYDISKEEVEKNPIDQLLKIYVKYNKDAKDDESLFDDARYWFKELENGNEYALDLWKWIRDISLKEFNKVYDMLNIKFDSYAGESFYSDKMQDVIEELEEKNMLVESDGAFMVSLDDYDMPPVLVKKSDGSTLYSTRDLAAAFYRKKEYDFYKNIYVVATEQNLHFKSFFKVIELMGHDWAKDCIHVPFGMISLEDGTLSTREGRVVYLEDVLNKAVESTKKIIEKRNPDLENKDEVAKQVGIGAVVFQELFNQRIKDYVFSWDRTLSFEGETGPYVQYTHARISSILDRADFKLKDNIDLELLKEDDEINIVREIYGFPQTIVDAKNKNEPFYITRKIVEIAKAYNKFYNSTNIINTEDEKLKDARLLLSYATKMVIKVGLGLLGIEAPERM